MNKDVLQNFGFSVPLAVAPTVVIHFTKGEQCNLRRNSYYWWQSAKVDPVLWVW